MRIIALSDTHGQLSHVNRIAKKHNANAVLHCGDFGFISHDLINRVPNRELSLNIKHNSKLSPEIRKKAWELNRKEKEKVIIENRAFGEFDDYLSGEKRFDVPVYAVWGNHEDTEVVSNLLSGENEIQNLELLTPSSDVVLDNGVRLFGIGGNFILKKFFKEPMTSGFYPAMVFKEWVELRQNMKDVDEEVWLLTHVSPGKEPLLENFGMHLRPRMWFSGHMGAPFPQHYSLFTIADDYEMESRSEKARGFSETLYRSYMNDLEIWYELVAYIFDNHDEFDNKYHVIDEFGSAKNLSNKHISAAAAIVYEAAKTTDLNEFRRVASEKTDFPSYGEYKLMEHSDHLFDIPFEIKDKSDSLSSYLRRKRSHNVKRTWYFNLPDVYTDGYVVFDTETPSGRYEIQAYGHI